MKVLLEYLKPHACFASTTLPSDKNTLVLVVISHGSVSNISNRESVLNKQQWSRLVPGRYTSKCVS